MPDQAELRQALEDLEEVRSFLAAGAGAVLLAGVAFALSDAMREKARQQRAERAERRAAKLPKPPAPRKRRGGR